MSRRFDLSDGQQCARDLFMCLKVNEASWPEVCSLLAFKLKHSSFCDSCGYSVIRETSQTYLEIPVPPNDSNLNDYLEDIFNQSELVSVKCEEGCNKVVQKQRRSQLVHDEDTKFLTFVLTRAVGTHDDGYLLNQNEVNSTKELFIRLVK